MSHGDQAGIEVGHHGCSLPVLHRFKNHVIALAGVNRNLGAVQVTAHAFLQLAWSLLLPTVSERASALAILLQRDDECDSCMSTERCVSLACHHLRSFLFVFKMVDASWPIFW